MRRCLAFAFLMLGATSGLADDKQAADRLCSAALGWCLPPQAGACEHPRVILEGNHPKHDGDPFSRDYEKRCISLAKSAVQRRGGELLLSFGNRTTRAYRDAQSCGPDRYEDCKAHMLYDFFPEHGLLLVHVGYQESQQWLLVRQSNGKEEAIVAPPRYSPDRKWLAAVNWDEGTDDGNNGIDIVSAADDPANRSFHYRPKVYELWEFVGWDGDDRLSLSVTWRRGNEPELLRSSAQAVRVNGKWQLNRDAPKTPRP